MRRRVLIPSDNRDFVRHIANGYQRLGLEVTTGLFNFELETAEPDVLHFLWPEELTGWRAPGASQIEAIRERLDRWAARSRLIASVNNIQPHRDGDSPEFRQLYSAVYERAEVIHHFSEISKQWTCSRYPEASEKNHLVQVGFNYDLLLPSGPRDRAAARSFFGLEPEETVFLLFGALRSWREVSLLKKAYDQVGVKRKRLLVAARYQETGPLWTMRLRRKRWRIWLNRVGAVSAGEYTPDDQVFRLFDAADVALVVRTGGLSSGLPCLAMTFGRLVVAPSVGAIPEYLANTQNVLYDPEAPQELARAMERAAGADRERIGAMNREVASAWSWEGILRACLDSLPSRRC